MKQDLKSRIQRMYIQDCTMAYVDVLLLWASILFVLVSIMHVVHDSNIRLIMVISSALLLLFNTASVFAMTKHFAEDKQFIYGMDIKHLDESKSVAADPVVDLLPVSE
ncbi:hypothetical protein [Glaciimonas sp. PCH181]|uniref:hypothetical protein n=1 Tax=Glaciimonas sp. PCH181 TaxID=2133943 RepID=UPI000D34876A|nr:hypothetical protein [Glaciimonas sp. PCH181]PUA19835.1 hypothetical protein C7W93_08450 [Glaciimonas sp. PCH181]